MSCCNVFELTGTAAELNGINYILDTFNKYTNNTGSMSIIGHC